MSKCIRTLHRVVAADGTAYDTWACNQEEAEQKAAELSILRRYVEPDSGQPSIAAGIAVALIIMLAVFGAASLDTPQAQQETHEANNGR